MTDSDDSSDSNETAEETEARINKTARAGYDLVVGVMQQLAMKADETASRNYAGFSLNGFKVGPFDRVEFEFMRPGGVSPTELVRDLKEKVQRAKRHLQSIRFDGITGRDVDALKEKLMGAIQILTSIPEPNP